MAYVYILESMKNGRYYVGSTKDVEKRFDTHRCGGVKATKNLLPLKIAFRQEYSDIDIARKIENKIKSFKRKDYIAKIIKDGRIKITGG